MGHSGYNCDCDILSLPGKNEISRPPLPHVLIFFFFLLLHFTLNVQKTETYPGFQRDPKYEEPVYKKIQWDPQYETACPGPQLGTGWSACCFLPLLQRWTVSLELCMLWANPQPLKGPQAPALHPLILSSVYVLFLELCP